MSLTVTEKGGGNRPLTPAGTHVARCIKLIDLGTQDDEFKGKPKIQAKLMIYWELPNELAEFKEGEGEKPYSISKEYTASLADKANLRHDLESWRGVPFTAEELKGFNLKNIVGKACMITVVHQVAQDGKKTYDKVATVSSMPKPAKGQKPMEVPPQVNPSVIYDIEDGENNVFAEFPDWIKEKIRASHEFRTVTPPAEEEAANGEATPGRIPF